ncbi:uncharacterized protein LOC115686086 [Syzygium oleosum]|uniref:uncharacterized protein LOC115686086 n=1 Tax=Syzygium oleosum TaxID=219896 RepID=UPI0024B97CD7|nr:uncharacterized protein LOC115686086 [Syzygium oleosum]
MINASSNTNIYEVLQLLLVLLQAMTSNAFRSNPRCVASSCGDIRNISYPFRLKSDPKGCGNRKNELVCEDNRTVLYFSDSRLYVQSINYSANQIRLVDDGLQKDNCSSLPRHSWVPQNFVNEFDPNKPYFIYNYLTLVIVNCSKQVSSPSYIATGPCIEGSYYSNASSNYNLYALVNPKASDVRDFCTISRSTWVSDDFGINISSYNYELIHNIMADGFVLYFNLRKTAFFCSVDFLFFFGGPGCISNWEYNGGKQWLAMKFYQNFA